MVPDLLQTSKLASGAYALLVPFYLNNDASEAVQEDSDAKHKEAETNEVT